LSGNAAQEAGDESYLVEWHCCRMRGGTTEAPAAERRLAAVDAHAAVPGQSGTAACVDGDVGRWLEELGHGPATEERPLPWDPNPREANVYVEGGVCRIEERADSYTCQLVELGGGADLVA
jgi:hypothetical protein